VVGLDQHAALRGGDAGAIAVVAGNLLNVRVSAGHASGVRSDLLPRRVEPSAFDGLKPGGTESTEPLRLLSPSAEQGGGWAVGPGEVVVAGALQGAAGFIQRTQGDGGRVPVPALAEVEPWRLGRRRVQLPAQPLRL